MLPATEILIKFEHDLLCLASDQLLEFDEYLRVPIRNRAGFAKKLREFDEFRRSSEPETTSCIKKRLIETFDLLTRDGEDLDRLSKWLLSMKDTNESDIQMSAVRVNWEACFRHWHANGFPEDSLSRIPQITKTFESYWNEHYLPFWEFDGLLQSSEEKWLASSSNRSDFDNYLYNVWYKDTETAPSTLFFAEYLTAMQRSWFYHLNPKLKSDDVCDEYFYLMQSLIIEGPVYRKHMKKIVAPLQEAFGLNAGCLFDDYCRDW